MTSESALFGRWGGTLVLGMLDDVFESLSVWGGMFQAFTKTCDEETAMAYQHVRNFNDFYHVNFLLFNVCR
jgi:hypothetical protein